MWQLKGSSKNGLKRYKKRRQNRRRIGGIISAWKAFSEKNPWSSSTPFLSEIMPYLGSGLNRILGQKSEARVLDIGSAAGDVAEAVVNEIKQRKIEMHTVDPAYKKEHLPESLRERNRSGKAEKLPYRKESFDALIAVHTLAYTDLERAVREMHRVLKDKGGAMLVLHHPESRIVRHNERQMRDMKKIIEFFNKAKVYCRGNKHGMKAKLHRLINSLEHDHPKIYLLNELLSIETQMGEGVNTEKIERKIDENIRKIKEENAYVKTLRDQRDIFEKN